MDLNPSYSWRSDTAELANNPAYGWSAVAPDNVYESVRDKSSKQANEPKLPKTRTPSGQRRKVALALLVASVLALVVVLLVSLSAVMGIYRRENDDLRQRLQSLLSEGNTSTRVQPSDSTTTTTDEQRTTGHPERTVTSKTTGTSGAKTNPETADNTNSPGAMDHTSSPGAMDHTSSPGAMDHTSSPGAMDHTSSPGTMDNPVGSCRDIPQSRPSGEYWVETGSNQPPVEVYCATNRSDCSCTSGASWMRVAYIDMTLSSHSCPDGLSLVTRSDKPLRTCSNSREVSCASVTFPTRGVSYSRVCGRVIGYQVEDPEGFLPYDYDPDHTIDDQYVDGVSLTHGNSPRTHIWTFASARDEIDRGSCPCTGDTDFSGTVPPFVGEDYFCDTGSRERAQSNVVYSTDPLWDGQGCGGTSVCCEFNDPPWFCKELSGATSDDIELRLCSSRDTSDPDLIESVEIYVY